MSRVAVCPGSGVSRVGCVQGRGVSRVRVCPGSGVSRVGVCPGLGVSRHRHVPLSPEADINAVRTSQNVLALLVEWGLRHT